MNDENFDKIYNDVVEQLRGKLTNKEYRELITLEYVLTWNFGNKGDEKRYKELQRKKYE